MTIIGISGHKQTGKDEIFNIIKKHYPSVERIAFADMVKIEVAEACGVTVEYMETHKDIFRPMYQWWGTDFRRNLFDKDYWIKAWCKKVEHKTHDSFIVAPDVRFLNEVRHLQSIGAPVWRVCRDSNYDNHPSETELDGYNFSLTINNNGTFSRLEERVLELLKTVI